jgi:hypothetical protein
MTNNIEKQSFGQNGAQIITAGTVPAGEYCALQFVTDGTLDSIAAPKLAGIVTGVTYPAGLTLFIQFTGAVVDTGTVVAYRSV